MSLSPQCRINVAQIGRDHIGGRAELAFLAALHVVWHLRKPNIDIEADLMAGVLGKHRPTAWLRHVANQKTVPANLFCVRGKSFDEANEFRIAPVAVSGRPPDMAGCARNVPGEGGPETDVANTGRRGGAGY